jgi:integrase
VLACVQELRQTKRLRLRVNAQIGKAFSVEDKKAMLKAAKAMRSPHIDPALMIALNTGLRDSEIRALKWAQLDPLWYQKRFGKTDPDWFCVPVWSSTTDRSGAEHHFLQNSMQAGTQGGGRQRQVARQPAYSNHRFG